MVLGPSQARNQEELYGSNNSQVIYEQFHDLLRRIVNDGGSAPSNSRGFEVPSKKENETVGDKKVPWTGSVAVAVVDNL